MQKKTEKPTASDRSDPNKNPLAYEPISKLLLKFAIPSVIAMLVNSLYNIADQIFVAQKVGTLGIGATTLGFTVSTIGLACSLLCGAGGSALAAIRLGEGKQKEAEKILGSSISLAVMIVTLVSVIITIFLHPVLKFFGATVDNMPHSVSYVSIILIGMPFFALSNVISNFLRVGGKPLISMFLMLCGAVINIGLDAWMVLGLGMGVKGAAIATITSQIISAVLSVIYICLKGNIRLKFRYLPPTVRLIIPIFSMGFSNFMTQMGFSVLQIVQNRSLVYYGGLTEGVGSDIALSSMGIASKLIGVLMAFLIGISVGAQPIVGFNFGMKNYGRVKKTYKYSVSVATLLACIGAAVAVFLPQYVVMIFEGSESGGSAFSSFAAHTIRINFAGVFCAGFQIVSSNFFQAIGQPFKAAVFSMSRQLLLLIPLILILPLFMGLDGILYATPCADISAAVIVALFIAHEMQKLTRLEIEQAENS